MIDDETLVDELLDMARRPDGFSKSLLGEMLLVAASEIIKLQALRQDGMKAKSPERSRDRVQRMEAV